jgi:hypothetical protein
MRNNSTNQLTQLPPSPFIYFGRNARFPASSRWHRCPGNCKIARTKHLKRRTKRVFTRSQIIEFRTCDWPDRGFCHPAPRTLCHVRTTPTVSWAGLDLLVRVVNVFRGLDVDERRDRRKVRRGLHAAALQGGGSRMVAFQGMVASRISVPFYLVG